MESGLGRKIQELLDEKHLSRKEFSDRTGITEAALSRYITGQREPKSVTLSIIARELEVSMDELLGTPCDNAGKLEDAIRLVARSASNISPEEKKRLIDALIGY